MKFYSVDQETKEIQRVTESRTTREAARCLGVAIGRWILSGLDLPEESATDGVSLQEAAMDL